MTTPHPLSDFFCPTSVALVGASDGSPWSKMIFDNFAAYGFGGKLFAVNRRGVPAHGLPGYLSCTEIQGPIDFAYVFVPASSTLDAVRDVAAAGIRNVAVLNSGFAEAGEKGALLQDQLVQLCRDQRIRLLGPNSLGFANIAAGIAVTAIPPMKPMWPHGKVGLVSQSGSITGEVFRFASQHGVGLSLFAATGNEAMIGLPEIIDYLIDDDATRAIAVYAETINDPAGFAAAARRALQKRKAIVIAKVGKSELTGQIAQAHTGALVGDDRTFDAVCRQLGVTRADSIEDLVVTASLLATTGPLKKPGIAVLSHSGGACVMAADHAAANDVALPAFAPETAAAIREVAADFGCALNPLDVTGAYVRDPQLFEKILAPIAGDPSIGLAVCFFMLPNPAAGAVGLQAFHSLGRGLQLSDPPGLLGLQSITSISQDAMQLMNECSIPGLTVGIDHTFRALGRLTEWSKRVASGVSEKTADSAPVASCRPRSERQVLDYLTKHGVPVVPAVVVRSADEAATAAEQLDTHVALKIASPDIQHKTEVGGVLLGLHGGAQVRTAYRTIVESVARHRPNASVDGVIVSPMRNRDDGVELFVGTAHDPVWGPVIAVGLGGIWVEVLQDTAIRPLPVTRNDVLDMLSELRGVRMLHGFRGKRPVDLGRAADVIVCVGNAALALGDDLLSLEINPLLATGQRIEALDGLTVWRTESKD